jgi:hypothetical protein
VECELNLQIEQDLAEREVEDVECKNLNAN